MVTTKEQQKHYQLSDAAGAIEYCFEKGWSDGLPVVPPNKESIQAMLDQAGLKATDEVVFVEHRNVSVTAEKVAINAVMAGCKSEYMPVIVATLEAMVDPKWGFHGPATSTGGAGILIIVNGPAARDLGMNSGEDLFGPGWRANATIGRAIRLVMRNVLRCLPGTLDRSTMGHTGRYTYCIAENEANSPWPPLHVERGFLPEQSTVTVFAALAPHQYYNQLSNTAEGLLSTLCAHMRISGFVRGQPQYLLIFSGEHAAILQKDGWRKEDIRRFCFDHTQTSFAELKRIQVMKGEITAGDETLMKPLVTTPDNFLIMAAGGQAGAFSAYVPGWGGVSTTQSVTREIKLQVKF
jgi:hypothetical protein